MLPGCGISGIPWKFKSKWVLSVNTTITHCRPAHDTTRKSHRLFIVTLYLKDNNSKATSFLLFFKMIAKLKWTQSNAHEIFQWGPDLLSTLWICARHSCQIVFSSDHYFYKICLMFNVETWKYHWRPCFLTDQIRFSYFEVCHSMTISVKGFWILTSDSRK